jgi:hypothetical protein
LEHKRALVRRTIRVDGPFIAMQQHSDE